MYLSLGSYIQYVHAYTVADESYRIIRFTRMAERDQLTSNHPKRGYFSFFWEMDHCRHSKTFELVFNEPESFITSCTYVRMHMNSILLFWYSGRVEYYRTDQFFSLCHCRWGMVLTP